MRTRRASEGLEIDGAFFSMGAGSAAGSDGRCCLLSSIFLSRETGHFCLGGDLEECTLKERKDLLAKRQERHVHKRLLFQPMEFSSPMGTIR